MRRRLFDHSLSMSDVSVLGVGCIFFVCSLVAVLSWCFVFLPYHWSKINSTLVIACELALVCRLRASLFVMLVSWLIVES